MAQDTLGRKRLEVILRLIGEGVIYQEADGKIRFFNQTAQRIFGISEEQALGRTSLEPDWYLIHEDGSSCPDLEHPSMITLRTGEALRDQIRGIFRPDRPTIWLSINTIPIFGTDQESPEAVVVSFFDITARKQAEEDLKRFFDLTPDLSCIASKSGYFLKLNPAWRTTLGYSEEELLSIPFLDLIHPDDRAPTMAEIERQLDGGTTINFVNRYRCKDGSYKWLEWQATRAVDHNLLYASARDITERKRNEEALQSENLRRRLLMDASSDGIAIFNQEHCVVEANQRFCEMLGYSQEEMFRLHTWDFEVNMPEEQIRANFADFNNTNITFETKHRRKDGSIYDVEVSASGATVLGEPLIVTISRDITDRKRAEDELRLHSMVLGQIQDVVTLTDMDGYISYVNETGCRILGRTEQELIGQHVGVFGQDPAEGATQDEILRQTLTKGQWRGQVVNVSANGDQTILDCRTQIVKNAEGQPIALCGISTDITERKQAEKTLRQSEEKFRALFASNPNGIALVETSSQRFLQANESFLDMLGYGEEELCRLTVRDVTHPDDWEREIDQVKQHLGSRDSVFDIKKRYLRKDGEIIWVRVTGDTLRLGETEPLLAIANVEDVTESLWAEEELRKQRQRLAGIIEGANVGTWEWNVKTGETFFNERWAEIIGYTLEELAPLSIDTWNQHIHPDDLEASKQRLDRHFRGELEYYDCECRMRHRDGHWVWVLDRGKAISRTHDGEPLLMFGTHIDITDLKNAEKEQARLQVQLAQAQKMDALGTLSSGIAHDFNNILAAILGYSELALDELPKDNPSVRQDLAEITKAALKAKKLVRQILTFSRVAEGQRRPLSVGWLAQESRAILARTLPKMIELKLDLQEGLWPVNADPQQMEQVIINLAANAADAIEGSGTVTIGAHNLEMGANFCQVCGEELDGRWVQIMVEDEGKGMSPEVLAKIFDPFFTTKGVGKGTGLGLSTVYGIVTGHGGHVCCQSKEGEGSTFFIYLPATSQSELGSETKDTGVLEDLGGSGKILVVDDEPAVRDIAEKMLTRSGYEVLQAASGEEALAIYKERSQEIDLVLLDLGMPGMGGKACLAEIRRLGPCARVLIASGYIQYELTDELESLGATGFVSKPYRKADILKAVKEAFNS